MNNCEKVVDKRLEIWNGVFLCLSFTMLFLFSRRDIYWQGAASFGATFFVLLGLSFFFFKEKNKFTISLAGVLGITGATFFYLISRKYNIFAYVDYIKIVSSFLVFIYASLLTKKYGNSFVDLILKFLLHALFFISAYSLFFYFLYSKDPLIFAYIAWPIISRGVVMGNWGYSNTFAIFMVLGVFVAQYFSIEKMEKEALLFLDGKRKRFLDRYSYDILTALFISILFITTSRFSMFIFSLLWIVYLILLMFIKKKYKKIIILKIILIFTFSSVLVFIFVQNNAAVAKFFQWKLQSIFSTLVEGKVDYSGTTRLYLIKFSIQQFLKNKILGNNFGSFGFLLRQYTQVADFEKLIDPHAFFARILVETGLVGFLTIFAPFSYLLLKKVIFVFRNKSNSNEFIIVLGVLAIFIHMNVDMDFVFPITMFSSMTILALLKGEEITFNIENKKLTKILGTILLLLSLILLPNFISNTLLLRKDMGYANYKPSELVLAKRLYPQNLYLNETIAENISNRILSKQEPISSLGEAKAFYDKYSQKMGGDYLPPFNEGVLLFKLGSREAIKQFKEAVVLAPMTPETNGWYAFSRAIFYEDISAENMEYAQRSIDITEGNYSGNLFFANYYRLTGQKTKMLEELKFLKANYPEEGIPYFIEYLYYEKIGNLKNMEILEIHARVRGFDISNFKKILN